MSPTKPEFRDDDWGPLAGRYRPERPRTLLALDGGGIRGLISLGVLQRLEDVLRERTGAGAGFRLCDFFDYIGGTSTGAIIAALLARGQSVRGIQAFYARFATRVFKRRINWWAAKFDAQRLDTLLADVFRNSDGSDADMTPGNLHCLFLAVTRNASTDSAWPVSSNPAARFNYHRRPDCNLRIPLWEIVRASAAAPTFFAPRVIRLDPRNQRSGFAFVDGGTTAYANPAFLLYRMATSSSYNLGWRSGEKNLLLVSVGTGLALAPRQSAENPYLGLLANAKATLRSLIHQASVDQDTVCRTIGRCVHGNHLDAEIGDLVPTDETGAPVPLGQDLGRAFLYARYNVSLTEQGLADLGLAGVRPERVATLDAIGATAALERVGEAVGRLVRVDHLGPFVDDLAEDVRENARLRSSRKTWVIPSE